MFSIRYIHAADLHLDAAFKGLGSSAQTDFLAEQLRNATFVALERLVTLCLKEKPDFLVLAGDIYNEEDQSLKAQLHLRDACVRLNEHNIAVFIVHGNHDPLNSRLQMLKWPEKTFIFQDSVQSQVFQREGKNVAVVHGISHANPKESRNLAKGFSRLEAEDCADIFQLGLLHCTLETSPKAERYAPCSVEDLRDANLDAWALGHVHEGRIVQENPFVAYSGNTQGLHINEAGPRGCLLVSVNPASGKNQVQKFNIESKFHALSPIVWESIDVDINEVEKIDEVEERILLALSQTASGMYAQCSTAIVRIRLNGRLELHHELRKSTIITDLTKRVREQSPPVPFVWLKDIIVGTSPMLSMEELSTRDDLLGETLRLAQDICNDDEALQNFMQTSLASLFTHAQAKHILQIPQGQDANKLMDEAKKLCADMMESR